MGKYTKKNSQLYLGIVQITEEKVKEALKMKSKIGF